MKTRFTSLVLLSATLLCAAPSFAEDYVITIKNHAFSPKDLVIPAGQKVKVLVKNEDSTPAEFESYELKREKIIGGNSQAIVFIGPLDAGTYGYFEEFHPGTTGTITAK